MKTTDLQKKNSIKKIIGMKIKDHKDEIVIALIVISTSAVIGIPVVCPFLPSWIGITAFLIFGLIKFWVIPKIQQVQSMIKSLQGMQYIPLTEDEVENENLDTIEKYTDFINNLITHNDVALRVPDKIVEKVIEFSNSYYHTSSSDISVVKKHKQNKYKIREKQLEYNPYLDCFENYFEHKKKKRKFVVISYDRILDAGEMREYLNMYQNLAEKLNLDLDADSSKHKSKYPAIQIKRKPLLIE